MNQPPRHLTRLLQWFCRPDRLEEITGDLQELYEEDMENMSRWRARLNYNLGILFFFKPGNVKLKTNTTMMLLSNYFLVGYRNLKRHKLYTSFNILGLTIGLTCATFMALYVLDELSYDKNFEKHDRIYRLASKVQMEGGEMHAAITPPPLGLTAREEIPEIEEYATVFNSPVFAIKIEDKLFNEPESFFCSSTLFDVLNFEFLAGSPETAFSQPLSMVISESRAIRFFGSTDIIGRKVETTDFFDRTYTITGILKDPVRTAHIRPHILMHADDEWYTSNSWNDFNNYNYVLVQEGFTRAQLDNKLEDTFDRHMKGAIAENWNGTGELTTENIADIHLYSDLEWDLHTGGNPQAITIMTVLALFILIVVSINFMNLTTSRAVKRVKEIGIRSMLGSSKGMIGIQFLAESSLITVFSSVLSLLLIQLSLPLFNDLSGKAIALADLLDPELIAFFLLAVLGIGIIGGTYPAIFLSRFSTSDIFSVRVSFGKGHLPMGKFLNMIQFTVALTMIILTWIAYDQLVFIREYDMGFNQEQVIKIDFNNRIRSEKYPTLITELSSYSFVDKVAVTRSAPGDDVSTDGLSFEKPSGGFESQKTQFNFADHGLIPLLELELVAGRNMRSDEEWSRAVVVNETLARSLGYSDINDIVGKRAMMPLGEEHYATIVGVIEDFNIKSLHHQIEPLMYVNFVSNTSTALVRVKGGNMPQILASLDDAAKRAMGTTTHQISFLDQDIWLKYNQDERQGRIMLLFASLTILLSLMGLIGLVSFTVEQKMKEMVIRKVFGASFSDVLRIFVRQYAPVVILALLLSVPVAYWFGGEWLNNYSYKIPLGSHFFIYSAIGTMLATFIVILFHTQSGYRVNPVDKLVQE